MIRVFKEVKTNAELQKFLIGTESVVALLIQFTVDLQSNCEIRVPLSNDVKRLTVRFNGLL